MTTEAAMLKGKASSGHPGRRLLMPEPSLYSEAHLLDLLAQACRYPSSQRKWALSHDFHHVEIWEILNLKRKMSFRVAHALGYSRLLGFAKLEPAPKGSQTKP